ncbi:unnamed protein product [Amoebophrya sp. A120]|nr:unnamed protein product [Amoebophrya sp. A120]|eukprot:GSA120T00023392001.1
MEVEDPDPIHCVIVDLLHDVRTCTSRAIQRDSAWCRRQLQETKHQLASVVHTASNSSDDKILSCLRPRILERLHREQLDKDVTEVLERHVTRVQENLLGKPAERKLGEFGTHSQAAADQQLCATQATMASTVLESTTSSAFFGTSSGTTRPGSHLQVLFQQQKDGANHQLGAVGAAHQHSGTSATGSTAGNMISGAGFPSGSSTAAGKNPSLNTSGAGGSSSSTAVRAASMETLRSHVVSKPPLQPRSASSTAVKSGNAGGMRMNNTGTAVKPGCTAGSASTSSSQSRLISARFAMQQDFGIAEVLHHTRQPQSQPQPQTTVLQKGTSWPQEVVAASQQASSTGASSCNNRVFEVDRNGDSTMRIIDGTTGGAVIRPAGQQSDRTVEAGGREPRQTSQCDAKAKRQDQGWLGEQDCAVPGNCHSANEMVVEAKLPEPSSSSTKGKIHDQSDREQRKNESRPTTHHASPLGRTLHVDRTPRPRTPCAAISERVKAFQARIDEIQNSAIRFPKNSSPKFQQMTGSAERDTRARGGQMLKKQEQSGKVLEEIRLADASMDVEMLDEEGGGAAETSWSSSKAAFANTSEPPVPDGSAGPSESSSASGRMKLNAPPEQKALHADAQDQPSTDQQRIVPSEHDPVGAPPLAVSVPAPSGTEQDGASGMEVEQHVDQNLETVSASVAEKNLSNFPDSRPAEAAGDQTLSVDLNKLTDDTTLLTSSIELTNVDPASFACQKLDHREMQRRRCIIRGSKRDEDNYEVSERASSDGEEDSDESPDRSHKRIPKWCDDWLPRVLEQSRYDPDTIFGTDVVNPDLATIFGADNVPVKRRRRGSSLNWDADRLTPGEVSRYKHTMGQTEDIWDAKQLEPLLRMHHATLFSQSQSIIASRALLIAYFPFILQTFNLHLL